VVTDYDDDYSMCRNCSCLVQDEYKRDRPIEDKLKEQLVDMASQVVDAGYFAEQVLALVRHQLPYKIVLKYENIMPAIKSKSKQAEAIIKEIGGDND